MKLSIVIPVHNEEKLINKVTKELIWELEQNHINYEIIMVNDNSTDGSPPILKALSLENKNIKVVSSRFPRGFGWAIRQGLENISGEAVVIFMGDGSDDPKDLIRYYEKLKEGYACVFGSRFIRGAKIKDYPLVKLIFNRLGNKLIQLLFLIPYNDVSNAFKAYRREVIEAIQPLVSQYFNITVEIPLKAIIRGFSYTVIPINWYGRQSGVSKYHIKELMRKYFFSILYVWLEKILLKEELRFKTKLK
ncbi:MAG: glycosyltransferase family 2 protein [Candidatus Omnitrophica bacterium]|nr:glycosyltransferase family 2 protein [Candidatus Omnitrophota bacterium]